MQSFYKLILDQSPVGYAYHKIIFDEKNEPCDYEFIEINPAFEKFTGLKRDNIIGKRVTEVIHGIENDAFNWIKFYGEIAINQTNSEFESYSNVLSRWYKVNVFSPEKNYFITLFTDITNEKTAEENLIKEKEKIKALTISKSQYLSDISYKLKTHLNGITGSLQLLSKTNLSNEQIEHIKMIKTSYDNLLEIIDDMVLFSRIEAGKIELNIEPFDLFSCIEELLRPLSINAHKKGLDLSLIIHDDVPQYIASDIVRIKQIIYNLVSNSIKYTEKGEIIVELSTQKNPSNGSNIIFTVKDTGIGMPKELIEDFNTPYFNPNDTSNKKIKGTGLGLYITKNFAEILGGKIQIKSEPNQGTAIKISLPLKNDEMYNKNYIREFNLIKNIRILIMDNNKRYKNIIKSYLKEFECEISEIDINNNNNRELLKREYDIGIINYEIFKGHADKLDLFLQNNFEKEFPFIILSYPLNENESTYNNKYLRYIYKPFSKPTLLKCMMGILLQNKEQPCFSCLSPDCRKKQEHQHSLNPVSYDATVTL